MWSARGVATHAGLRAVVVEDAHTEVGIAAACGDEHQAVAANAFVAVAPHFGPMFGVGYGELQGVDVDVVVSGTVDFKLNAKISF